jgi:hypothetical protein
MVVTLVVGRVRDRDRRLVIDVNAESLPQPARVHAMVQRGHQQEAQGAGLAAAGPGDVEAGQLGDAGLRSRLGPGCRRR